MEGQIERIKETLEHPESIVVTEADETVHVYQRFYDSTAVTSKYLLVAVKILDQDAFILTAFFSSRPKKGKTIWQE